MKHQIETIFNVIICSCIILGFNISFYLAETPPPAYSPQDDSQHGSESNHQTMDTNTLPPGKGK